MVDLIVYYFEVIVVISGEILFEDILLLFMCLVDSIGVLEVGFLDVDGWLVLVLVDSVLG